MIRHFFGCGGFFLPQRVTSIVSPIDSIASDYATILFDLDIVESHYFELKAFPAVGKTKIVPIDSVLEPELDEEVPLCGASLMCAVLATPLNLERTQSARNDREISTIKTYSDRYGSNNDVDFSDYSFSGGDKSPNANQSSHKDSPYFDRTPRVEMGWYSPKGLSIKSDSLEADEYNGDNSAYQFSTYLKR